MKHVPAGTVEASVAGDEPGRRGHAAAAIVRTPGASWPAGARRRSVTSRFAGGPAARTSAPDGIGHLHSGRWRLRQIFVVRVGESSFRPSTVKVWPEAVSGRGPGSVDPGRGEGAGR